MAGLNGTPEGTRTPDLLLRRQLLYPAELLAHILERVTGIGPAYPAWKAGVLPLNYTRKSYILADSALGFYHNYTLLSRAFSRIIGIFL